MNEEFCCPICRSRLTPSWEISRRFYFSGVYVCASCGPLKISGTRRKDGSRFVELCLPVCPCGIHDEVSMDQDATRYSCWACGRRFEIRGKKLITTLQPASEYKHTIYSMGFMAPAKAVKEFLDGLGNGEVSA